MERISEAVALRARGELHSAAVAFELAFEACGRDGVLADARARAARELDACLAELSASHYAALALAPFTDDEKATRRAYLHLSKQCHPDKHGGAGKAVFVLVHAAYETLSEPAERRRYDDRLRRGATSGHVARHDGDGGNNDDDDDGDDGASAYDWFAARFWKPSSGDDDEPSREARERLWRRFEEQVHQRRAARASRREGHDDDCQGDASAPPRASREERERMWQQYEAKRAAARKARAVAATQCTSPDPISMDNDEQ